MRKTSLKFVQNTICVASFALLMTACGEPSSSKVAESSAKNTQLDVAATKSNTPESREYQLPDGSYGMKKDGLQIRTDIPTSGPELVVWNYFKFSAEKKYQEVMKLLGGSIFEEENSDPSHKYLKEITSAEFVRWTDLTAIMPREKETLHAYAYKVIYMEVNLKLLGAIPKDQTGYRVGLNHVLVSVIQETKGGEWKIVVLGSSPLLDK